MLPVLCVALSYAAVENPVTSLDAGEIAEVDEGDFADMFDSKGPCVPVKVVDCRDRSVTDEGWRSEIVLFALQQSIVHQSVTTPITWTNRISAMRSTPGKCCTAISIPLEVQHASSHNTYFHCASHQYASHTLISLSP